MSVYDAFATGLLLLLTLPLLVMAGSMALHAPRVGAATTIGLAAALWPLRAHAGTRLVDVTIAAVVVGVAALAACTVTGAVRGFRRGASR